MFFQCFEFMITYLESYMAIMLVSSVLVDQKEDIRKNSLIAFVLTAVVIGLNQVKLFSVSTTMVAVVLLAICAKCFYRARFIDGLIAATFFAMLTYMVDFFNIAIFASIIPDEQVLKNVTAEFSWYRIVYICACKVVLSVVCIVLSKKILRYVGGQIRKVWVATIVAILVVGYFCLNTAEKATTNLVWTWLFMILFFVLAVYAVMQYLLYVEERNRLKMALDRNQLQIDAYNKLIRSYQLNQAFLHDLKNQYLILENYLKERRYEEAEKYITELKQLQYETQYRQITGILPIDILLSYKEGEAKEKQIQLFIESDQLMNLLPEQEMVSIIGNVLDLAMDSCMCGKNESKQIYIKLESKENRICIIADYPYECREKKIHFFSREDNAMDSHALDVAGTKMLVEKYHGTIDVVKTKAVCTVSVVLNA